MSSPILEVNSVSKSFGNIKALDNVDFYLQKGVVHGLLGENGAGKSSLMNVLSGIYLPESGTIKIKNQNIHKMNPDIASSYGCLLYTSPSPRDLSTSRMPSSA